MQGTDGKWIGWGYGDESQKVVDMKAFLKRKFKWVREHVPALDDSPRYDETMVAIVIQMQKNYGFPASGVMNYDTQVKCGFVKPLPPTKQWLFTVHGTGQPVPDGPGLPWDTALSVRDKYQLQPIGNYPAKPFPMWPSILQGVDELNLQISSKPGKFSMIGYSQGAVVVGQVLKHQIINPKGALHHRIKDLKKVVMFGNPMRQQGIQTPDHWLPVADTATAGILEDRLEGFVQQGIYGYYTKDDANIILAEYAHEEDMYASCPFNDMGEDERAICKIIMGNNVFGGQDSILAQIMEIPGRPIRELMAMFRAIKDAGAFFGSGTRAHGYDIAPAIQFLRVTV